MISRAGEHILVRQTMIIGMFLGPILKRRNQRNVVPSNIVTWVCQFQNGMLLEPVSSILERDLCLSLVWECQEDRPLLSSMPLQSLAWVHWCWCWCCCVRGLWSRVSVVVAGASLFLSLISGAWRVRCCGNTKNSEEVTKESGERENLVLDSELAFSEGLQIGVRDCAGCWVCFCAGGEVARLVSIDVFVRRISSWLCFLLFWSSKKPVEAELQERGKGRTSLNHHRHHLHHHVCWKWDPDIKQERCNAPRRSDDIRSVQLVRGPRSYSRVSSCSGTS